MAFIPFSERELEGLRLSGKILSQALATVVSAVQVGVEVTSLNQLAEETIRSLGGAPSFLGYHGYPASLCVSFNDEVVHGIPISGRTLEAGDLVGLDLGVVVDGMYTDMARTVAVGAIAADEQRLLKVTNASLAAGLAAVRAGATTGDIGAAIQAVADVANVGIVRDLVGHGVGRAVHEDPSIPNFGKKKSGTKLRAGMALAIEPMLTLGGYEVQTDDDGWTVRTVDGSKAAHEERTVLVTTQGYELLTP